MPMVKLSLVNIRCHYSRLRRYYHKASMQLSCLQLSGQRHEKEKWKPPRRSRKNPESTMPERPGKQSTGRLRSCSRQLYPMHTSAHVAAMVPFYMTTAQTCLVTMASELETFGEATHVQSVDGSHLTSSLGIVGMGGFRWKVAQKLSRAERCFP